MSLQLLFLPIPIEMSRTNADETDIEHVDFCVVVNSILGYAKVRKYKGIIANFSNRLSVARCWKG